MPRNQKLTKVIAGRTIKAVTTGPGSVLVLFDDQSTMNIKTAVPATIPTGGKVKSVHEAKAEFKIDFEDNSSMTLNIADPGSSVAVRERWSTREYFRVGHRLASELVSAVRTSERWLMGRLPTGRTLGTMRTFCDKLISRHRGDSTSVPEAQRGAKSTPGSSVAVRDNNNVVEYLG